VFLRLLAESLRRGRRRKLLAGAAIAVGTAGVTALVAVLLRAGDEIDAELARYGANLSLASAQEGETLPVESLDKLGVIFWRNNIKAAAPLLPLRVRVGDAVVPVMGTWFERDFGGGLRGGLPRVRPTLSVDGRWPAEDAAETAIGRRLAAQLALGRGEILAAELGGTARPLRIVGIVGGGGEEEDQAFAPLAQVALLAASGERFARAEVAALTVPEAAAGRRDPAAMSPQEYDAWYCTAFPSAIAHQLEEAIPGSSATVIRQTSAAASHIQGRLRGLLLLLVSAVALGTVIGATAAMASTLVERRLEVGLLRALGAERRRVAAFFLSEAALVGAAAGLLGGVLGLALGGLLVDRILGAGASLSWELLPLALGMGVLTALLGSVVPVWRAVRESPVGGLKRAWS
jgi:putative ABC transport system permease protein